MEVIQMICTCKEVLEMLLKCASLEIRVEKDTILKLLCYSD